MCALVALLSHLHDCANFLDEEYEEVADLFFTFNMLSLSRARTDLKQT